MRTQIVSFLLIGASVLLSSGHCFAMQADDSLGCSTEYENHNQVDYGPLKISVIEGQSVIEVGTQQKPGVPGACFTLFEEKDHKFVASVKSGADGHFELRDVVPGHYRLIARAKGSCSANIPLEVKKSASRRKQEILVHFRPAGIDTCSFGELVPPSAKR